MQNITIGTQAATQEGFSREFKPRQGWKVNRSFRGPQAYIEAKELELSSLGYEVVTTQGPVWTLEASASADALKDGQTPTNVDEPVNTWELFADLAEKDVLSVDIPVNQGMDGQDKNWLREVLDGKVDTRDYDYTTGKSPTWHSGTTQNGYNDQLYKGICAGIKSARVYAPKLRHTMTVNNQYNIPPVLTGVGELYSSAKLAQVENIPNLLVGSFPTSAYGTRGDSLTIYKGWLKGFPQISIAAQNKIQIIQEFEWGEWATILYPTINT